MKRLEHEGYHFEVADASRAHDGHSRRELRLLRCRIFRVLVERGQDRRFDTAAASIIVGGERLITVGEGDGPVNALDNALQCSSDIIPNCGVHLTDYKVLFSILTEEPVP